MATTPLWRNRELVLLQGDRLLSSVGTQSTAGILPAALAIPSTDSIVHGYRIAMTPDHLLGRSESARRLLSLSIAPLGPLAAGLLLAVSSRAAVALFAASGLALAVWGTASPSVRAAPRLEDLGAAGS
ncbi:MAG: hypothetical protein ACRDYD_05190 [Acidimicrobiales bacterium]